MPGIKPRYGKKADGFLRVPRNRLEEIRRYMRSTAEAQRAIEKAQEALMLTAKALAPKDG